MATIDELIDLAERARLDEEAREALRRAGAATATAIMDHTERRNSLVNWQLGEILIETADERHVSRAVEWLTRPSGLALSACDFLGGMGDPVAAPALLERLCDPKEHPHLRSLAGDALRRIRAPGVATRLRELLDGWGMPDLDRATMKVVGEAERWDARALRPPVAAALALAALGDHRDAPLVFRLATLDRTTRKSLRETGMVRLDLMHALGHVVGDGLIAACAATLKSGDADIKEQLAPGLARIGSRDAIELLVKLASYKSARLREVGAAWLADVAGANYPEDEGAAKQWWDEHAGAFEDGVTYLRGKPWTIEAFLEDAGKRSRADADQELEIVLGVHVRYETRTRGLDRGALLAELAQRFTGDTWTGKLMRYGLGFKP
jgi:hypothetical protein